MHRSDDHDISRHFRHKEDWCGNDPLNISRCGVEFEKSINAVVAYLSDRRSMEGVQS